MVKTNNKFSTMNKHFFVSMLLGTLTTTQSVFAQKMTLTIKKNSHYENVNFELIGVGEVTINWGNDERDIDFLGPNSISYEHSYPPYKVPWIITITGAKVRYLNCNNYSNNSKIKSLDVSKNIKLKNLWCRDNKITSLDMNGNIGLKVLNCRYNKLTYPTLNVLFESLHDNDVEGEKIVRYLATLGSLIVIKA